MKGRTTVKTRSTSYQGHALTAVRVLLALVIPGPIAAAQNVSPEHPDSSALESTKPFYPPQSRPFGKSFPEWSAEWWQFVASIPIPQNPVADDTGQNCALGQHGPVWFLFGSFGSTPVRRTCSIPEDRALFFPVINRLDV